MAKLVNDKSKQAGSTMFIVNALPGKYGHDEEKVHDSKETDPMYDIVISNYEEREKEILQENSFLRQLLYDFYQSIETRSLDVSQHLDQPMASLQETVHGAIFQLPLEMMRDTVLEGVEKSLEHYATVIQQHSSVNNAVLKDLELKIGIYLLTSSKGS